MKLKKLEIFGFKSFLEKAGIEFPSGICAVVGPNGCGKSNVFDALRWVMGEQSVKQLRGKSMDDVIFSGASGNSPLNMAEVSLTLINDGSALPDALKDYSEIMITRRLYRSGESVYLINKRPCRLKDVHNVFLGSGLGAKSYAIIQQGRIGAITDAGPDERRFFIEEAAGVTRYKLRKEEALRKLEATQQNLLRLNDIISEVERQINGLKRQAAKAEQYNRCQEQIIRLDVQLTLTQCKAFSTAIETADRLLIGHKDIELVQRAELKKLDATTERIRLECLEKNELITERKTKKFETHRRIDKIENESAHLREEMTRLAKELIDLETAMGVLMEKNQVADQEIHQMREENISIREKLETAKAMLIREQEASRTIRERLDSLNDLQEEAKRGLFDLSAREAQHQNVYQHALNMKETLNRRLRRADEQEMSAQERVEKEEQNVRNARQQLQMSRNALEDVKGQIAGAERDLREAKHVLTEQDKAFQTIEIKRKSLVSRYTTLKKMEDSLEWYKDGVKAVLSASSLRNREGATISAELQGVLGIVADVLEPAPGYETAVEAVLGDALQYILVSDHAAGKSAIDYLQQSSAGRGGFVPVAAVKSIVDEKTGGAPPKRRLLDHVSVHPEYRTVAEAVLGHVAVVEDFSEALALYHRNGTVQTIVTKSGDTISHQGIMIGGGSENLSGILLKKKELRELQFQIAEMDKSIDAARIAQSETESKVKEMAEMLHHLIEIRDASVREELEAEKALYKASEDLKNGQRHLDVVRLEQEQISGEQSDVDNALSRHRAELTEIQERKKVAEKEMDALVSEIRSTSSRITGFDQRIVDCKLEQTALSTRLENGESMLQRLAEYRRDGGVRLAQLEGDIEAKSRRKSVVGEKLSENEIKLADLFEEKNISDRMLEVTENEYQLISSEMRKQEKLVSDLQEKRQKTLQEISVMEEEQSRRRLRLEAVIARFEERYQRSCADLERQFFDGADTRTPAEIESVLETVRQQMKAIGEVNPGAIREYEVQKERYVFLTTQASDLKQAMDDLQHVIRKINRVTQERFLETLGLVNQKLKDVFPRLFEGGSAELVLTDSANPLDSGLEFMIHPPGKKVTRLSLLSGGEKALSAIAFIFSIFLIKPASFCLMDEIDAPLDESNVFRFNELLRIIGEQSQIVMITHNKRSMEFADTLFGVTMEKKGISKIVSVNLERREAA